GHRASEIDVRCHAGNEGRSGLVMLTASLSESDPIPNLDRRDFWLAPLVIRNATQIEINSGDNFFRISRHANTERYPRAKDCIARSRWLALITRAALFVPACPMCVTHLARDGPLAVLSLVRPRGARSRR